MPLDRGQAAGADQTSDRSPDYPVPVQVRWVPQLTANHLLLLWLVAATIFALRRLPYDDEWFSLTLASQTDWPHFWRSLANDVHPPWVALIDRALFAATGSTHVIRLCRILAVAFALALLRRPLSRALAVDDRLVLVAAWHPIFFYYAGAARWYPFLFLAMALRLSGLLTEHPLAAPARRLFLLGALIGPAAGYIDLPFVVVDSAIALWWSRGKVSGGHLLGFVGLLLLVVLVPMVASPLSARAQLSMVGTGLPPALASAKQTAAWLGLGLAGEAFPSSLPILLACVSISACVGVYAYLRLRRCARTSAFGAWLVGAPALWVIIALAGKVWHPRYSIGLWWLVTIGVLILAVSRHRLRRSLGVLGLVCLSLSLTRTIGGRGFLKADLNEQAPGLCAALADADPAELIVAPYPRTAELIRRTCTPSAEIISLPLVRHYPDAAEQTLTLGRRLAYTRTLLLVEDPVASSLSITNERVREAIARQCRSEGAFTAGEIPFSSLKRLFLEGTRSRRFLVEGFGCMVTNPSP